MDLTLDFAIRFINITLIDIALSGDNAIVIGMAAALLPPKQRRIAIVVGGGLAIVLRLALTSIASFLMLIPLLSALGGITLVWVVYKLLKPADTSDSDSKVKQSANLRQAIGLILTADFMMSVDNVIAVAGSAHGNLWLLIAGLLLSMPLLLVTGGLISAMIEKARWLVYVGAVAISFTSARMILEDKLVADWLGIEGWIVAAISVIAAIILPVSCVGGARLLKRG